MNTNNILFDFDDILLESTIMSEVNHRSEIDCMINGKLPIFTAPMFDVIGLENFKQFENLNINTIIPRSKFDIGNIENISHKHGWVAVSLEEMESLYDKDILDPTISKNGKVKILIDVANGHMQRLYDLSVKIKERYGDTVQLMIGNVANPITYAKYAKVVDYVRIGVGNGCFVPGTLVQTLRGVVAIEDIVIGDYVLTHKNRYMKVTETFIYERDESLFFINGEGSTSNHEYYVIERKYKDIVNDDNLHKYAKWISAEELDEKIHLLIEY